MKKTIALLLALSLAACSVAVPQPGTAYPVAGPPTSASPGGQETQSPPSWAELGLTGSLILILHPQSGVDIARMDLATGTINTIYHAPDQALVGAALVSPDQTQILMMYAPPATASSQVSYTSLYLLPMDGSGEPKPLLPVPTGAEAYFAPVWAPDGKSVYTSHFIRGAEDGSTPDRYEIDQVDLSGKNRLIIKDAMWPSLSPDGTRLSYVTAFSTNGQNDLYLAKADGTGSAPAIPPGSFLAVDAHFFSPDGKAIIFSAVNPTEPVPTPTVWERLFGIQVASAHNVPSDWYQVPVSGGAATRLTNLNDTGMYATLSPDHQRAAFISQTGIYVMNLDGSQLTQLNQLVATGTVDWVR